MGYCSFLIAVLCQAMARISSAVNCHHAARHGVGQHLSSNQQSS